MTILADVRLYREGLAGLLAASPRVRVVGAGPIAGASLRIADERPDVVLLDAAASHEVMDGIARAAPWARVVAYGVADDEAQALRCAELGVAFVTADATTDDLLGTIEGIAAGEFHCPPRLAASLLRRVHTLARGLREEYRHATLTPRERGVLRLVDEGLSNKEIAGRLNIELSTVKNHVHNILEKLQVNCRSKAAARLRNSHLFEARGASSEGI